MSLDLSNKHGVVATGANITDLTSTGLTLAKFTEGDVNTAAKFLVKVDTSAGDIDASTDLITSLTLADGSEAFEDGTELTLVKLTTDSNKITFTDSYTGILYNYLGTKGERLTLVFDATTSKWILD